MYIFMYAIAVNFCKKKLNIRFVSVTKNVDLA